MQLNELQPKTKGKKHRQVGRGGKRGKTSGKGHKGQKARSGHRIRPAIRDIIKKIPKKRGYRFHSIQKKPVVVIVKILEKKFESGAIISPTTLLEKRLVTKRESLRPIKILGKVGAKKFTFSGVSLSNSLHEEVTKAGGKIE